MKLHRKKKFWIPLVIILFLAVLRIIAPSVILKKINAELKDASPTLTGHVADLDLKIIFGSAELEGITASIKESGKEFLKVESVKGALNLTELLKGNIEVSAIIKNADLTYSSGLMEAVKKHVASQPKEDKPLPDIRISRVDLKDSIVRLEPYPSLTKAGGIVISDIDARATNLIPQEKLDTTLFSMQGKLLKSGDVKINGAAKIETKPLAWSIDSEILHFDLTTLNQFLRKKVPLTFTRGQLDFFAEAKSEDGKVSGYLKPFVENLDVIKGEEDFKNTRHWIFEIISALGNIVMQEEEVAATRVPFVYEDKLQAETGESIGNAFEHSFIQEISRGIENTIELE